MPLPRLSTLVRLAAVLVAITAVPAEAQALACPDLAAAKPVGACPTDAELRYTFIGYCSDNARMYDGKGEVCDDFAAYRRLKNVALWESADGAFDAYPSCELAPDAIRGAKAMRISASKRGTLTQVVCEYAGGIRFTHRTKAQCKVAGNADCAADPASCAATCE